MSSMSPANEPGRMDAFKAQVRRAVVAFVVIDVILVIAALVLYFAFFQPALQQRDMARDDAIRAQVAMQARVRAVEARYALTVLDMPAALQATKDVKAQIEGLQARVPKERADEAAALRELAGRADVIAQAMETDPGTARKDLELLESRLATLYPAVQAAPARR